MKPAATPIDTGASPTSLKPRTTDSSRSVTHSAGRAGVRRRRIERRSGARQRVTVQWVAGSGLSPKRLAARVCVGARRLQPPPRIAGGAPRRQRRRRIRRRSGARQRLGSLHELLDQLFLLAFPAFVELGQLPAEVVEERSDLDQPVRGAGARTERFDADPQALVEAARTPGPAGASRCTRHRRERRRGRAASRVRAGGWRARAESGSGPHPTSRRARPAAARPAPRWSSVRCRSPAARRRPGPPFAATRCSPARRRSARRSAALRLRHALSRRSQPTVYAIFKFHKLVKAGVVSRV